MTRIVIKDLAESVDLDRQAMTAIVGGARVRGQLNPAPAGPRARRVVEYPNTLPQAQGTGQASRRR
ncbi:MAG TPA: hypothetical protein VEC06_21170 [Paucimonas sp.]|nr:hypothetical protein [Paucimonas sp.]